MKRHVNMRLEDSLIESVDRYATERKTTRTAAIESLLRTALEANGRPTEAAYHDGGTEGPQGSTTGPQDDYRAVIDVLRESNADLRAALVDTRAVVASLTLQLATKDEQIERAHGLADQAQKLQAMAETKALTDGRPSLWRRVTGRARA